MYACSAMLLSTFLLLSFKLCPCFLSFCLHACQVGFLFPSICTDEKERRKKAKKMFYGVLFSDTTLHDNITQREAHHTGTENGPCQMSACRRTAAQREVSVGAPLAV